MKVFKKSEKNQKKCKKSCFYFHLIWANVFFSSENCLFRERETGEREPVYQCSLREGTKVHDRKLERLHIKSCRHEFE
jgi:hypothetical protein